MYGIGTDIEEVKKFSTLLKVKHQKAWQQFFTKRELAYCSGKTLPEMHLAARFAGKEAVVKAMNTLGKKIKIHEIEIINKSKGEPQVRLPVIHRGGTEVSISLSHTKDFAIAFAIAQKK